MSTAAHGDGAIGCANVTAPHIDVTHDLDDAEYAHLVAMLLQYAIESTEEVVALLAYILSGFDSAIDPNARFYDLPEDIDACGAFCWRQAFIDRGIGLDVLYCAPFAKIHFAILKQEPGTSWVSSRHSQRESSPSTAVATRRYFIGQDAIAARRLVEHCPYYGPIDTVSYALAAQYSDKITFLQRA